ncbi:MAG: hypothetical protein A3H97_15885 [Acidobacteria bacterium RIFCSPLOWO2_02_FULL_65_29]|nr:MAG: hypothetical protein A3H97_15885 [Acidobacteria bacterium RIFCSPLOWO2_02_FULL_65_29]
MPATKISSKGQVVLPTWVRRDLDLRTGDILNIEIQRNGGERTVILRAPSIADVEAHLVEGYQWLEQSGRDPVAALHEARQSGRIQERQRRGPGRGRRAGAA